MAKIPFGILGAFIGTAGPIIGKTWKTKAVITSSRSPSKRDKNPTPGQDQQRSKFGVMSRFLGGISRHIKTSFAEPATDKTEFQCAMSYNMCHAISGTKGNYTIHYNLVSVGRGSLPNAEVPEAKAGGAGEIQLLWADNTGIGSAAATDRAIMVMYCPDIDTWVTSREQDTARSEGSASLVVPIFSGHTVHTWLTFVNGDGKTADSVYTGEVKVK